MERSLEKRLEGREKKSPRRFKGPALNVNTVTPHTQKRLPLVSAQWTMYLTPNKHTLAHTLASSLLLLEKERKKKELIIWRCNMIWRSSHTSVHVCRVSVCVCVLHLHTLYVRLLHVMWLCAHILIVFPFTVCVCAPQDCVTAAMQHTVCWTAVMEPTIDEATRLHNLRSVRAG